MYSLSPEERDIYLSQSGLEQTAVAVAAIIGNDVSVTEHYAQGGTTVVFNCETTRGAYIARRGKNEKAFQKDSIVGESFRDEWVPAPTIEGILPIGDDSFVCVSHRLPGENAQDSCILNPRNPLHAQLMGILAAVHTHNVPSNKNTLFAPLVRHSAMEAYSKFAPDQPRSIDKFSLQQIARLQQHLGQFALPELGRLCHNDIKGPNVLVRDGEISGLVDWAMAEIGDPASDLGVIYARRPEALDYSSYVLDAQAAQHLRERVIHYAMASCVGSIRFFGGMRDNETVQQAERRLITLANEAETAP